jgi:transposase InsO family protein
MISLEERQKIAAMIEQARCEGARLKAACEVDGIDARTLQRWETNAGLRDGDARPRAVRPVPAQALSAREREQILRIANEPRFAALPPARIVLVLADEGVYIASESSFSRVLRAHDQTRHRGRAKARRRVRPLTAHVATGPRQVWTWDLSRLPTQVLGFWCYFYPILDVYSPKIVGFKVHETVDSDHAVELLRRTALAQGLHSMAQKPVLHGDNGWTLKATTVLAMMYWLGLKASYSRPRVSDDNAFVKSLFRTANYRPEFPTKRFADLPEARRSASSFVTWYNNDHKHSGIRYVSPAQRHAGEDHGILAARHGVYLRARATHPRGTTYTQLESDHRRHAQSRALLSDQSRRERCSHNADCRVNQAATALTRTGSRSAYAGKRGTPVEPDAHKSRQRAGTPPLTPAINPINHSAREIDTAM